MHIAITIWAILTSWRIWSWERFHQFHATILYISAMNLLYLYLSKDYPLWKMQPEFGLSTPIADMLYTFIVFPCTAILFLSKYPKTFEKKIRHTLKWIAIYIGVESIGSLFSRITYHHGWHIGWSLLFVIVMFLMFRLHYNRPLLTYLLTFIFIVLIFYYFKIPWTVPMGDCLACN